MKKYRTNYIKGNLCTSENDVEKDIVTNLCKGGVHKVHKKELSDKEMCYRRYDTNIVFKPPKVGTDILLLQHFFDVRRVSDNEMYVMEEDFERKCVVYHVEKCQMHSDNYYDPDNKVILTFYIRKEKRKLEIPYMYFFCGFYYAKEITKEHECIVRQFRKKVDMG